VSTYLAIGSICWDEVPVAGRVERRLGGSVLFASRVAQAAGWHVRVLTSGTDELASAARAALPGVALIVQPSAVDTIMRFPEQADQGPQWVPTVAEPVAAALLRDAVEGADVVHLAPIMGEVDEALAREVVAADAPFVGITPQGLLRDREPGTHRLLRLPSLASWWSSLVDAAVVSEEEHAQLAPDAALERVALAVTRGELGCSGRLGEERIDVPGIAVGDVDPASTIGAGDVFAAACFLALAEGAPFAEALGRANRTAAAHVARRP
jgi:sugar/nucleoside kinase (ribokinase family)